MDSRENTIELIPKVNSHGFTCYIIGEGSLVIQCAKSLLSAGHTILGIITSNTDIIAWLHEVKIKNITPDIDYIDELRKIPFDYLFSIVNLSIISDVVIKMPLKGIINYHDSLLPRYAGIHATSWAIINKESFHGVSWHLVTSQIDEGHLIKQKEFNIDPDETALSLNLKCYTAAIETFKELINELTLGTVKHYPQDLTHRTLYKKYQKPHAACVMHGTYSAEDICALVSGLNFGPVINRLGAAKIFLNNRYVVVKSAKNTHVKSIHPPGRVVGVDDNVLTISTRTYNVILSDLELLNGDKLDFDRLSYKNVQDSECLLLDKVLIRKLTTISSKISSYEEFWAKRLAIPVLFYTGVTEPYGNTIDEYASISIKLPDNLMRLLRNKKQFHWVNLVTVLIAAYLCRVFRQYECIVGFTYDSLRDQLKNLNNVFADVVPLRVSIDALKLFDDILFSLDLDLVQTKEKYTYLYDLVNRNPEKRALFDGVSYPVIIRQTKKANKVLEKIASQIDISIDEGNGICYWKFNTKKFTQEQISSLTEHFKDYLFRLLTSQNISFYKVNLLSDRKRKNIVNKWNNKNTDSIKINSIIELIAVQANRFPNHKAIEYGDDYITYKILHEKSDYIANCLLERQISKNDRVGIMLDRSINMLIAMIAVLKSGAAYVPLDPAYPKDRLFYMLEDAAISTLITSSNYQHIFLIPNQILMDAEYVAQDKNRSRGFHENTLISSTDIAYVIYTSGSTGKPKGVQITHGNLVNFMQSMEKLLAFSNNDKMLAITSICFDIAALELLLPLCCGGKVEILPTEITKNGIFLKDFITETNATIIQATPATWNMLFTAQWSKKFLGKIICGGEKLTSELASRLLQQSQELWNMYGPTETTIWSAAIKIMDPKDIPIGKPIDNTEIYILDEYLDILPIGYAGEVYIAGAGVSPGYLNQSKQNKERFLSDPFSKKSHSMIYKTGDLGVLQSNGLIRYISRIDDQIKLHGFRIELGEIERTLLRISSIREVVVVINESPSIKMLVAFYVLHANEDIDLLSMEKALKEWLPDYMAPTQYIHLLSLPLTYNRKIDRKYLSTTPLSEIKDVYGIKEQAIYLEKEYKKEVNKPSHNDLKNKLEEDLKTIIADIIGLNPAIINNKLPLGNYGFNSISFTSLSVEINKKFLTNINPALFYQFSSIEKLIDGFLLKNLNSIENYYNQISDEKRHIFKETLNSNYQNDIRQKIAIIGMAGNFPGSSSLDEFWKNLVIGNDLITEFPQNRASLLGMDIHHDSNFNYGGFIYDIDKFDADFFSILPREAEIMDPRQRLFLQVVWQAIENSGYKASELSGKNIGVYVGITGDDYARTQLQWDMPIDPYTLSSLSPTIIANRVSYYFNFHGPSHTIDTACSSSLVAVHRAIADIQCGACDMAIAAGINIIINPHLSLALSTNGMLSPDRRCKSFDKSANGYVRGEGICAIFLKPLSIAKSDKDFIHAVVLGSSENHGGRTNSLTAPNPNAQAELIISACHKANIDFSSVSYIEAHGTGTALGDPIEIEGLKLAYDYFAQSKEAREKTCGIGSVKTNIGHLEAAAGIAGLCKIVLAMQHQTLPRNLHFAEQNPYFDISNTAFYILDKNEPWNCITHDGITIPRRAGVSSFGFGGVNAHIILEEHYKEIEEDMVFEGYLILLSAKNSRVLRKYASDLYGYLTTKHQEADLSYKKMSDISYTLLVGRECMEAKLAIIASDIEDLLEKLRIYLSEIGTNKEIFEARNISILDMGANNLSNIDLASILDKHIKERNYIELIKLWFKGALIPWDRIYDKKNVHRLALPSYPFDKKSYWLNKSKLEIESQQKISREICATKNESNSILNSDEIIYFTNSWEESSLKDINSLSFNYEVILIFDMDDAITNALRIILDKSSYKTIILLAVPGENWLKISQFKYQLNPASFDDYKKLLSELKDTHNIIPKNIIYLWDSVVGSVTPDLNIHNFRRTFYSLMYLFQALAYCKVKQDTRVLCVHFPADYAISSLHAGVAGFAKTISKESPYYKIKILEINNVKNPSKILSLIDTTQLYLRELINLKTERIRYQEGLRYIHNIIEISDTSILNEEKITREAGVYLIAGGMGSLGRILIDSFANMVDGGSTFIAIGRSELTPEQDNYCSSYRLKDTKVIYRRADISNIKELKVVIDSIVDEYGKINAVIHCAGAYDDAFYWNKIITQTNHVLQPKIDGIINLDKCTAEQKLNFFVVFSSISGVFGNIGQTDYAYANGFMDDFSQWRAQQVLKGVRYGKTLSIDWPLWSNGSMGKDEYTQILLKERLGIVPLSAVEGLAAFMQGILYSGYQIGVLKGNRKELYEKLLSNKENNVTEIKSAIPQQDLTSKLKNIVAHVGRLNPDELSIFENLSKYGFESLSISELVKTINSEYKISLSPISFFEYPTISSLSDYIANTFKISFSIESCGEDLSASKSIDKAAYPDLENNYEQHTQPIAIIGMAGIFPGSNNLEEYWDHLKNGHDLISEVSDIRWSANKYDGLLKNTLRWGGFIGNIEAFDAEFFHITDEEANHMDPQQRIFLEMVWKAIEDAGYKASSFSQTKLGVYVGVAATDYLELIHANKIEIAKHTTRGNTHSILANRVSYFLDANGPSEAIDTACSSSLVALHRAVTDIQAGYATTAIVGGVNLLITPTIGIASSKAGLLSPEGRCKVFDKQADGYVRGEGAGAILLKPLTRAIEDGDHIYATIRGVHTNHSGHTGQLSIPNAKAQTALLKEVYTKANIDFSTVGYIEAHGTGTSLGDPIEMRGLVNAFQFMTKNPQVNTDKCGIGSVKANIGHLETASGIAGIIKVLLCLKYKTLCPTVHFKQLNPYIDFKNTPFFVVDEQQPWDSIQESSGHFLPRRAGISSFGFGGTNAHAILEEYNASSDNDIYSTGSKLNLFVLSAKNKQTLKDYAKGFLIFLENNQDVNLLSMLWTLQNGRESMKDRLAIIISDTKDLIKKLADYCLDDCNNVDVFETKDAIYNSEDNFIDKDLGFVKEDIHLKKLADYWVRGGNYNWINFQPISSTKRLSLPTYPFLKTHHWIPNASKPVRSFFPAVHKSSSSLSDISYISELQHDQYYFSDHIFSGRMILPAAIYLETIFSSIKVEKGDVPKKIGNIYWISPLYAESNINALSTIFDGKKEKFSYQITSDIDEKTIYSRGTVSFFNEESNQYQRKIFDFNKIRQRCRVMNDIHDCYRKFFMHKKFMYGEAFQVIKELYLGDKEALSHLKLPEILDKTFTDYSLHPTLVDGLFQTAMAAAYHVTIDGDGAYLPFSIGELNYLRPLIKECYAYAVITEEHKNDNSHLIKFNLYLVDSQGALLLAIKQYTIRNSRKHTTYNQEHLDRFSKVFSYDDSYVADHTVFGKRILLGVTYCGIAIDYALKKKLNEFPIVIDKLLFERPAILSLNDNAHISFSINDKDHAFNIECTYDASKQKIRVCTGKYLFGSELNFSLKDFRKDDFLRLDASLINGDRVYDSLDRRSVVYGPSLRNLKQIYVNENNSLGELKSLKDIYDEQDECIFYSSLIDAAMLSAVSLLYKTEAEEPYIPLMIKKLIVHKEIGTECYCFSEIVIKNTSVFVTDIFIYNQENELLISLYGFTCKRVSKEILNSD